jgi:hypothetical protein
MPFYRDALGPLLAHSGHHDRAERCPLSGVKQTSSGRASMSAYAPIGPDQLVGTERCRF